jgi:hypothetical protein
MNAPNRRLIRATALLTLLLSTQMGSVQAAGPSAAPLASAPAGSTLTAQPSIIGATVKPGATSTTTVTLAAGIPLDISLFALGLGQSADGGFLPLPTADDKSPYTGVQWVTAEPAQFHLDAGQSRAVKVTVHAPADAGQGSRYAILEAQGTPTADGGNVAIGINLGLSVVITLDGTEGHRAGDLQGLAITPPTAGAPFTVTAMLQNTGNTHYGMPPFLIATKASLQGPSGAVVATGTAQVSGASVIPSFRRKLTLDLTPLATLADGNYHLELEADLPGGQILDRAALDFKLAAGTVGGATQAPASGPQTPGTQAADTGALILSALFGGVLMTLLLLLLFLGRRRLAKARSGTPGAR